MHRTASLTGLLVTKPAAPVPQSVAEAAIKRLPPRPAPKRGNDGLTRVSLRINSARHLRLRLAAAHLGLSNHGMMVAAIDHYIEHVLPEMLAERTDYGEGHTATSSFTVLDFRRAQSDAAQ